MSGSLEPTSWRAGFVLEVTGEFGHRSLEGGREQLDVPVGLRGADDASHGGQESHVGHAVGFVDHDRLDVLEAQCVHLQKVLETTGACDHERGAAVERLCCGL